MKQFFSIFWNLPFGMVIQPPIWGALFAAAAFGFHPETGGLTGLMLIISSFVFLVLYAEGKELQKQQIQAQHQ